MSKPKLNLRTRLQTWTYSATWTRITFSHPFTCARYKYSPRNAPSAHHRRRKHMASVKRFSPPSPISTVLPIQNKNKPLPTPLRLDSSGVEPSILVGKVLQKTVRSCRHPMITFHFSDSSIYQVHVEGYHPNPAFQGVPKELEVNPSFDEMLNLSQSSNGSLDLTVTNCSFIRLTDKAFERKLPEDREERWDQNHLGLAFKFEGRPTWHCVWAAVVDHDQRLGGREVFRSYEDVYLQHVAIPSPNKSPATPRFHLNSRKRRSSKASVLENNEEKNDYL